MNKMNENEKHPFVTRWGRNGGHIAFYNNSWNSQIIIQVPSTSPIFIISSPSFVYTHYNILSKIIPDRILISLFGVFLRIFKFGDIQYRRKLKKLEQKLVYNKN